MSHDFLALCLIFVGYIVGLGAVTVIDLHGWLGRTSSYWTEATTRTHKITKPLIWIGLVLAVVGTTVWFANQAWWGVPAVVHGLYVLLVCNGLYLSFVVSSYLLRREACGNATALLPARMQRSVFFSFVVSFLGWWGSLVLVVYDIAQKVAL